jgi:hypothetical protein
VNRALDFLDKHADGWAAIGAMWAVALVIAAARLADAGVLA